MYSVQYKLVFPLKAARQSIWGWFEWCLWDLWWFVKWIPVVQFDSVRVCVCVCVCEPHWAVFDLCVCVCVSVCVCVNRTDLCVICVCVYRECNEVDRYGKKEAGTGEHLTHFNNKINKHKWKAAAPHGRLPHTKHKLKSRPGPLSLPLSSLLI